MNADQAAAVRAERAEHRGRRALSQLRTFQMTINAVQMPTAQEADLNARANRCRQILRGDRR
jgi:hypothetical protein